MNIKKIAGNYCKTADEKSMINSFAMVIKFLKENGEMLSCRGKDKPNLETIEGVDSLAKRYFSGYRRSDFPAIPGTVPDEMVSIVMKFAYDYPEDKLEEIKLTHQHSMCAENCVGALLERYINSVLKKHDWHWCCGDFVKAIDFISKNKDGKWIPLQIKNRNNTENSSSSAIRNGTDITKWFRSHSTKGGTNWNNIPVTMKGYGLSEKNFISFVEKYLKSHKM